ncbi:hypothetical protein BH09VER1_BH09VER1_24480 [soil metagenome]
MKPCNEKYEADYRLHAHRLPGMVRPRHCPETPGIAFQITQPGDLLAWGIHRLTGAVPGNCACNQRRAQMNRWGWAGCLARPATIVTWLAEEAEKRGHVIGRSAAWSVLRAAVQEARSRPAESLQAPGKEP